jgi:hypothetical protein
MSNKFPEYLVSGRRLSFETQLQTIFALSFHIAKHLQDSLWQQKIPKIFKKNTNLADE